MLERNFQKAVIKWLKGKGCFVWKMQQNATTQAGVSDIFFCIEGFYGFLEVKKGKSAKRRPGQEEFVKKMNEWSYAKVVFPENWDETRKELEEIIA